MVKRFYKHKLVLDEGFHLRQRFPLLNNRFDIKHIAADYHLDGLPDPDVYDLAKRQHRILVTYNVSDFAPLIRPDDQAGVIGVSPNISLEHIDKKLTALLTRATKHELLGKLTFISEETKIV